MAQKLKDKYQQKLNEERAAYRKHQIILENFDQATADKTLKLMKQLNAIKWPNELPSFKYATKKAIAELKSILSGAGRGKNLFDKIVGLFKSEKENPVVDVVAYISAISSFFNVMGKLTDALEGSNQENATVGQIIGNDETISINDQQFNNIIKKGLKPEGSMANIKTNWLQKYMGNDTDAVAHEISNMSPKALKDFSLSLQNSLAGTKEIANSIANVEKQASQSEDVVASKESEPAARETPAEPTTATTATTPNTVKPGHQDTKTADVAAAPNKEQVINAAGHKAADALVKLGIKSNIPKLMNALYDAGVLKMPEETKQPE